MRKVPSLLRRAGGAFGEFVLIVVGVLVALTVDQWAETRREKELEAHYLARLLDDVTATVHQLEASRSAFQRAEVASRYLDSLLSAADPRLPDASTLYIATQRAYRASAPIYTRTTLEEMESAGGLRLLEDWELRRVIIYFYRIEENHAKLWEQMDTGLRQVLRGVQYPSTDERFFEVCPPEVHPADCPVEVPGIDVHEIWNRLRSAPDVHGLLRENIRDALRAQEILDPQIARAENLISQLEEAQER